MFPFYRDLTRKSNQIKNCKAKIELLGSYDPQKQMIIEDPYYVSTPASVLLLGCRATPARLCASPPPRRTRLPRGLLSCGLRFPLPPVLSGG